MDAEGDDDNDDFASWYVAQRRDLCLQQFTLFSTSWTAQRSINQQRLET